MPKLDDKRLSERGRARCDGKIPKKPDRDWTSRVAGTTNVGELRRGSWYFYNRLEMSRERSKLDSGSLQTGNIRQVWVWDGSWAHSASTSRFLWTCAKAL